MYESEEENFEMLDSDQNKNLECERKLDRELIESHRGKEKEKETSNGQNTRQEEKIYN